jgi:hypothetical protein
VADDREHKRLRETQERLEREEAKAGEQASDPDERRAHERRADKASYLSDKLAEQAEHPDESR